MDTTDLKQFLDPKFPLLEKFRSIIPGTFKHSGNVSNMCETVALEMGLDIDLMKVCGLYHDIGKMNHPLCFNENQNGINMHDELDPYVSYQLITRHVGDTLVILMQVEDMPRKVMEIVSQHHGNTVLKHFYDKSGLKVDEDVYRYNGMKPQSLEASILMICDSVEAAAKAKSSNGKLDEQKDRRTVVNDITQRFIDDDQLDNMRVGELKIVKRILTRELDSIYHRRDEYSKENELEVSVD